MKRIATWILTAIVVNTIFALIAFADAITGGAVEVLGTALAWVALIYIAYSIYKSNKKDK